MPMKQRAQEGSGGEGEANLPEQGQVSWLDLGAGLGKDVEGGGSCGEDSGGRKEEEMRCAWHRRDGTQISRTWDGAADDGGGLVDEAAAEAGVAVDAAL